MNIKNFLRVSGWTMVSRVLGLLRDMMLARYLGATIVADMFFVALKIPNLFRRIFAEGAMQSVFIPIFSSIYGINNQYAKRVANEIFIIFFICLLVIVVLLEVYTYDLVKIMSPGLAKRNDEIFYRTVQLVRITLPYLFFISLVSFYSSILNTLNKFSLVAFLPALLNIMLIVFIFFGDSFSGYDIAGSYGVFFGGLMQLLFVMYGLYKSGWLFIRPSINIFNLSLDTKSFFKKLLPVILGGGIYQINIVIDIVAASLLSSGSISYLFYADRIYQLPLALIGISIATVILPSIAKNLTNTSEENRNKSKAILIGLWLSVPASVGLFIFAEYIVNILFLGGDFNNVDVKNTALCIMIYVISLPANVLIKIILPFFYSKKDIKTPLYSTIICLFINVFLVFLLSEKYGFVGIASATTIASYINFFILVILMLIKKHFLFGGLFFKEITKIFVSNTILFLLSFYLNETINLWHLDMWMKRFLMMFIIIACIIYTIIMWKLLKSILYKEVLMLIKR